MSTRYIDSNDLINDVPYYLQNIINNMDCVYIDGIKPNNQHFNLAEHDKQIRDEVIQDIKYHMSKLEEMIVATRNKNDNLKFSQSLISMQNCVEDFLCWLSEYEQKTESDKRRARNEQTRFDG